MAMMRVSNNMIYGQNMQRLSTLQAQLMKTQQHLSANTRLLTPADDPVAAARALDLKQGKSMNTQFASNRGMAADALKLQESTLGSVTSRIQDIHTLLVNAGDGAYSEQQLNVLAAELRAIRDEMVGYANTRDPFGDYLFSGHQAGVKPFDMSAIGQVTYMGDNGQRMVQVDAARYMAATDPGSGIFMGIRGTTASTVDASRNDFMMGVTIKDINDPALLMGYTYRVEFTGTTPVATYDVYRSDNPLVPIQSGNYTGRPNEALVVNVDGIEFSISGQATTGDWVEVTPGAPRRDDMFVFINDAINLLENTNLSSPGGSTNLMLGIGSLLDNFAATLDQVLTARSSTGTRLKELDALNLSGMDKDLQYTESISNLEDLDYYKAISDLMQQMLTLEAAQKTFMQTTSLSLFNLM